MGQDQSQAARQIEAGEVEALLAEILARADYAPAEPPPLLRWIDSAWRWIDQQIGKVFGQRFRLPEWDSPVLEALAVALLAVCALIALALIGYLLFLGSRAVRRRRRVVTAAVAPAPPATAGEWEARAAAAAARHEWRRAAMALYQAVLLRLSAAGAVALDRSKTPGDYRRDVQAGDRDLAARFDRFLGRFEHVAFGPGAPGEDQYVKLMESAEALGSRG